MFLTLFVATHVSILTSDTSSAPRRTPSQAYGTLRYRIRGQMTEVRDQILSEMAFAKSRSIFEISLNSLHQCCQRSSSMSLRSKQKRATPASHCSIRPPPSRNAGNSPAPGSACQTLPQYSRRWICSHAEPGRPSPYAFHPKSIDWPCGLQEISDRPARRRPRRCPSNEPASDSSSLSFDICQLSSDTRSFGAWLEPRYIFGAGWLI